MKNDVILKTTREPRIQNLIKSTGLTLNVGQIIKNKKAIRPQIQLLIEIFKYFLQLGFTSFGGPLAAIGIMQKDLVEKRAWLDEAEFTKSFTFIKAMPGPISFMMATYLGRRRGGFLGGLISAIAYVFPAFLLIIILAEYYQRFEQIDFVRRFLAGLQIAAFALIVYALKTFIQKEYKNPLFVGLMILSAILYHFQIVPEPIIILGFGALVVAFKRGLSLRNKNFSLLFWGFNEQHLVLFQKCLKAGALVFGTGFAILPVLRNDFVVDLKWISEPEFLNALAFGQMTPGPIVITTTYIGYKALGLRGAILATLGVFLPSFLHIQTWFSWMLAKLENKTWILDFILGASAAVAGSLAVTLFNIGHEIHLNLLLTALFVFSIGAFFFAKKIPTVLVLFLAGLISSFL